MTDSVLGKRDELDRRVSSLQELTLSWGGRHMHRCFNLWKVQWQQMPGGWEMTVSTIGRSE